MNAADTTLENSLPEGAADWTARLSLALWAAVAVVLVGVFVADLIISYSLIAAPCAGPDCHYQAITPAEADFLAAWDLTVPAYALYILGISVLPVVLFTGLAVILLSRLYPKGRGFLFSLTLIAIPVIAITSFDVVAAAFPRLAIPIQLVWVAGQLLLMTFFVVFPRGRFEPRWTVSLPVVGAILGTELMFGSGSYPFALFGPFAFLLVAVSAVIVHRYRRLFDAVERRQMKWVVLGMLVFFIGVPIWSYTFEIAAPPPGREALLTVAIGWTLCVVVTLALPAAIFVAIARENLLDINLIVRRTLVYILLTALLAVVYILSVLVMQNLLAMFTGRTESIAIALSTLLIASLFRPVRDRLQRATARHFFGERDDPYAVLSRLSHQLAETAVPGETLPVITAAISETLKLSYVAILVPAGDGRRTVAATGEALNAPEEWPLRHHGQIVGWLVVATRTPGEAFTLRERQLLADIASQAGAAAFAAQLTVDLQRSRERLVLAREEERRRIRRDLHDELGPALASQTFKLDAALDLLETDPAAAAAALRSLKTRNQELVGDIRRLVHELRPPALDELGLSGALRAHSSQIQNPTVSITAVPDPLPLLPAAVEVAAYRIALEAVTNAVRHAKARTCAIILAADVDRLTLTIVDDGAGLPDGGPLGIGLRSMRERAEEVGGSLVLDNAPAGGARVTAILPTGQGSSA